MFTRELSPFAVSRCPDALSMAFDQVKEFNRYKPALYRFSSLACNAW